MTEVRVSQGVHRLCTTCAPFVCLLGAGAVQAGAAWDMFEARCLDPFEHQAEAVVSGLAAQPVDQMHDAKLVFTGSDGLILVLDAAPREGNRSCAVVTQGADALDDGYVRWAGAVTAERRYVADGDVLASAEWIEPQVHVAVTLDASGATYTVLETDLES